MTWQKGKSGNPGGRPKEVEEFKLKARRAVDQHVLQAWIDEVTVRQRAVSVSGEEIIIEERGPNWIKASELLAAYGYGKPAQSLEVSGPDGEPLLGRSVADMSEEELAAEVARLKALREGGGK